MGRREDARLVTGHGRFLADIRLPDVLHAVVLRSPYAHARIRGVDLSAAQPMPGVALVVSGRELAGELGPLPCDAKLPGATYVDPPQYPMALDRVRFVGDSVALVVAESVACARDAAEQIAVDYELLPAVTDPLAALLDDAPRLWDEAPGNLCVEWTRGEAQPVEATIGRARHVVRAQFLQNRVVMSALETRQAIGIYEEPGQYTLYATTQGSDLIRRLLAEPVLGVSPDRLRVITPDVGGGFGLKHYLYGEYALVLWAAKTLGRPVRWVSDRIEAFQTDVHGRELSADATLALDGEGRFLALRVDVVANMGAYASTMAPFIPTVALSGVLPGLYTTPHIYFTARGVFTNTTPIDAYRGAGRPEGIYVLERIIDEAARQTGIDRITLRQRNLIPEEALPYRTPTGHVYDSGSFARNMEDALALAGWDGFEQRRRLAAAEGRLRGIGLANYLEDAGGFPRENARVTVTTDGRVEVSVGTQSTGQGHETSLAELVAAELGIPAERVELLQGDSQALPFGFGTGGSRTLLAAGSAARAACLRLIERARQMATHLLECALPDLRFTGGAFAVAGTDKSIHLFEIARAALRGDLPDALKEPLAEYATFTREVHTYPNGCHVCELEVDPDTGRIEIANYVSVDDFGRLINRQLVEGQVHGGVVQGIGQALLEQAVYDESTGQLLTASYMDYCLPRADDVPLFTTAFRENPCRTNPLGVKGAGEAGAIAAPAAVMNAVLDALASCGVRHLDMPATPGRVWTAIHRRR